jgi:hypothetical protein
MNQQVLLSQTSSAGATLKTQFPQSGFGQGLRPLIWPLLLLFCLRLPGPKGRWKAAKIAIAIVLVSPLIRVVSFTLGRHTFLHNSDGFHTHADSLMFAASSLWCRAPQSLSASTSTRRKIWWILPAVIVLSDCLSARY